MKKRFFKLFTSLLLVFSILLPIAVKADTKSDAEHLLNLALKEKTFYHYNVAYAQIMNLPVGTDRDNLLSKLAPITNEVWSPEIIEINKLISEMANKKSAKAYDQIEAKILKSNLKEVDKNYLSSELYGWGRNLVWTDDYKAAVDAVIEAWNKKTVASIQHAKDLISKIKVEINKEYLLGELANIKPIDETIGGTRENPISLRTKRAFNFQEFSFYSPKKVELQLLEYINGDKASAIVENENMFNTKPKDDEEWILMKFNLKYVSGPEEELRAPDIIFDNFYTASGQKIAIINRSTFSEERKGFGIHDVKLYPGGESVLWYGILVKKSVSSNPLIRIGTGYDESQYKTNYTWFSIAP